MKIMDFLDNVSDVGKSVKELQAEISVQEVWHIWDTLIERYDVIETTQLLHNFADDVDLQAIIVTGLNKIRRQAARTEELANKYGIPLPSKPPEKVTTTANIEEINDKYIFRRVFRGIQDFLTIHMSAYIASETPEIREAFKTMLMEEISIYDNFFEYGKLKGWTVIAPKYKN